MLIIDPPFTLKKPPVKIYKFAKKKGRGMLFIGKLATS